MQQNKHTKADAAVELQQWMLKHVRDDDEYACRMMIKIGLDLENSFIIRSAANLFPNQYDNQVLSMKWGSAWRFMDCMLDANQIFMMLSNVRNTDLLSDVKIFDPANMDYTKKALALAGRYCEIDFKAVLKEPPAFRDWLMPRVASNAHLSQILRAPWNREVAAMLIGYLEKASILKSLGAIVGKSKHAVKFFKYIQDELEWDLLQSDGPSKIVMYEDLESRADLALYLVQNCIDISKKTLDEIYQLLRGTQNIKEAFDFICLNMPSFTIQQYQMFFRDCPIIELKVFEVLFNRLSEPLLVFDSIIFHHLMRRGDLQVVDFLLKNCKFQMDPSVIIALAQRNDDAMKHLLDIHQPCICNLNIGDCKPSIGLRHLLQYVDEHRFQVEISPAWFNIWGDRIKDIRSGPSW